LPDGGSEIFFAGGLDSEINEPITDLPAGHPWITIRSTAADDRQRPHPKCYARNVAYEVSGKKILSQWFSYRRRDRSRPVI